MRRPTYRVSLKAQSGIKLKLKKNNPDILHRMQMAEITFANITAKI